MAMTQDELYSCMVKKKEIFVFQDNSIYWGIVKSIGNVDITYSNNSGLVSGSTFFKCYSTIYEAESVHNPDKWFDGWYELNKLEFGAVCLPPYPVRKWIKDHKEQVLLFLDEKDVKCEEGSRFDNKND